jgi:hypothetical protein
MAFAPTKTYFEYDATILGSFVEKDYENLFEFSVNDEPDHFVSSKNYPHKVWVAENSWRYARVLKTVAYVITDEDADGYPVVERWFIKNHNTYVNKSA